MSFEDKIPEHIAFCERQIKMLYIRRAAIDWGDEGHDCDCEYCDSRGEGATDGDTDAQEQAEEIDTEVVNLNHTIDSLKAYAAVHKVKLELTK